jgi:hypothetical protein
MVLTNSSGTSGASLTPLSPTENLNNSTSVYTHQTGREEKSGALIFSVTGVDLACMDETNNHTLLCATALY